MDEEDMTAQVLRMAGTRAAPSADQTLRVQEAVRKEWRAARRRRLMRRSIVSVAIGLGAAAALLLAVRMRTIGGTSSSSGQVLAVAERAQGSPQLISLRNGQEEARPMSADMSVHMGEAVDTGSSSRVALRALDGSSVRIDRGSRVRFLAPAIIDVRSGAVYVATALGSVGFEVRVSTSALRLRVRSGAVELRRGEAVTPASGGTEATATADGVALRQVEPYGDDWAWTSDVAPPFAIEGQPLSTFLAHLVSEQGWRLTYGDPQLAETARRIVLHGSIEGLKPEEALEATLATSGLRYRLSAGTLTLSR